MYIKLQHLKRKTENSVTRLFNEHSLLLIAHVCYESQQKELFYFMLSNMLYIYVYLHEGKFQCAAAHVHKIFC